jgi:translation initiation factor eIF-2B subunit gamma
MAGGRGGGLYPLTTHIPKILLPISNKPMIIYVLEMLERSEYKFQRPILIVTQHEYQKKLEKCLETRYRSLCENSFHVIGVPEDYPGTMGSLRYLFHNSYIPKKINDILIVSGDLLLDFSVLPSFIDNFRVNETGCSIMTHIGKASTDDMQIFALNQDRIVQIFEWIDIEDGFNLPVKLLQKFPRMRLRNNLIQNYCYLFTTSVLENILEDVRTENMYKIKEDLIPFLLKRQSAFNATVSVYIVPENLFSMRVHDIKSYLQVNMLCCTPLTGKEKSGQSVKPLPLVLLSTENTPRNILISYYRAGSGQIPAEFKQVTNDSIVQEDFKIGEKTSIVKSVIGKNTRIGSKCKITGSIIMDNVIIEDEVNINNSIIGPQVSIGTKCKILNSQMAFGSTAQPSTVLKEDIRLSII